MNNRLRKLGRTSDFFGINPYRLYLNLKSLGWFISDFITMRNQVKLQDDFKISSLFPTLLDKHSNAGNYPRHYFLQDLLVAQKINQLKPIKHVDIGSRIDGFVAHVASFRSIEVFDIRPLSQINGNIHFLQADVMGELDKKFEEYTDSLSCLHAIEHFGLGRYGDTIDVNGHLKGISNMTKMLKPGGWFYLSTPIGTQRIEFNAHRVFNINYLLHIFDKDFFVKDFFYIDDTNQLHNVHDVITSDGRHDSFGCYYGCGIFILQKKP